MQACKICYSPYREEVMRAWKSGFNRRKLYEKYMPLLWGKQKITYEGFLLAFYKHKHHQVPDMVIVPTVGVGKDAEGVAKAMTELFAKRVEGMKPEDVSAKDYVAVNKLVIEKQKLQLDKNEQMMAIAKLFGIQEPIKGEMDEPARIESGEVTGDQPENS